MGKSKIRRSWKTIASRVSGFSTPLGGVSWAPASDEYQAARELVIQLENRRVLFVESEAEVPEHCVHSVVELRCIITSFIARFSKSSDAEKACRRMRAACVQFLKDVECKEIIRNGYSDGHFASWTFLPALGALRARIGEELAVLANLFEIDVEEDLAKILPPHITLLEEI